MPKPKKSLEDRFWPKVNKTETCWLWIAAKKEFGYGVIGCPDRRGRTIRAHRVSWELANGKIPEGMFVLHKCDVPSCVNQDHLFLGTRQENVDDMVSKGRQARIGNGRAEASPNSKLCWKDVREIRQRYSERETLVSIARSFSMNPATIAQIVKRKTWKEEDHEAEQD